MSKRVVKPEIRTLDKETGEVVVTPAVTVDEPEVIDPMIKRGMRELFKTPNNHDTLAVARQSATVNIKPSLTQTAQAADTDINLIMKKFGVTGVAPGAKLPPSFIDVPDDLDLQKAIDLVNQGKEAFESQPAHIRAYFRNDMARYAATVDQLRKSGDVKGLAALGLTELPPEPKPAPKAPETPPTPETPAKEPPGGKD